MQRLTGLDAGFLYLETPSNHMHVAATAVFDPSTVPGGWSFEKVRALVEERLPLLPPFRRRLVPTPFELTHPVWVEDPDFDLHFHVRRVALPAPGDLAELARFSGDVMGRPLDRNRPLWEMWVVEGLQDGLVALVSKTHHAAIDGVSGAELIANLLDVSVDVAPVPADLADAWRPERVPTDPELVFHALRSLAGQPVAAAKAARRTAEALLRSRSRPRRPDVAPPPAPFTAPRTSLNTALTPHRLVAFADVALDDVKQVKAALGGTVNDVVLAMCAGGLRSWFDERGEHVAEPLVAFVPMSVRTSDEQGAMGNRVTAVLVSLATDLDDPVERLRVISAATGEAKEQERAIGAAQLTDWAEFAAPAVAARAARLYSRMRAADRHRPWFNVVVSNVPGPRIPLWSAGARLTALYPMGPVIDGAGLNITVMSYLDRVYVGLNACKEVVPDVDRLADALPAALDELVKAAVVATPR